MARIYISATYSDLIECRKAVYDALRSMKHDVIAMEHYVAADQRPLDKCLEDVGSCDLYVGIFAWRYGYVPTKDNPERKSITELEFRHAVAKGIPCLLFLLDENAPWPRSQMEQGAGAKKLKLLRAEMSRDYIVSFFETCHQLASQAIAAVANWNAQRKPPIGDLSKPVALTPDKISTSRLPITGSELFGRDEKLQLLDEAWNDQGTHILSLVAWGGVGKSALVNHWLGRMARDDYRGAERAYAWSFYSQGTTDRVVSADQFIEAALVFFGDPDPNKGSPWDKGERLAQLAGAQRTLLVLDGLEPLQHPPGTDEGRLKDQALQSLLRSLAASNKGLCLISTRVTVTDLSSFDGITATRIDLEHLSPKAGAQVLTAQGVTGTQAELEKASEEFGGHSLALTLLGSYLSDVCGGDVNRRTEVKGLEEDEKYGRHAQKVMASYGKWFGEGPELSVLRMLGLFNRPADGKAVRAVRVAPVIKGLTDSLRPLSSHKWQQILARLRRAKLLSERDENHPDTLDAHPLVREHFGKQLKEKHPKAWRAANSRLYEHYKRIAKVYPDTIEEMASLYSAVAHGCEAGRHQEVLEKVYWQRILRRHEAFSIKKLGAVGAEIASLSSFFDQTWLHPVAGLTEPFKAFVLGYAGFVLQALGQMTEAAQPMQAGLDIFILREDWINATTVANNISELHLTIGDISKALTYAQHSIELADKSGAIHNRASTRATLARVLHQAGHLLESDAIFHEAEDIQKEREPDFPLLYSIQGFWYCDLLLEQGKNQEVRTRAIQTLESAEQDGNLLSIALDHLSLGRAFLPHAQHDGTRDLTHATNHLNQSVNILRQAGQLDDLPRGLLARAELYRVTGDLDRAWGDLDEAIGIAKRGSMGLHEADCHLEYARLYLARGEREKARESWATAREMIARMGYHRRDRDVEEIGRKLGEAGS